MKVHILLIYWLLATLLSLNAAPPRNITCTLSGKKVDGKTPDEYFTAVLGSKEDGLCALMKLEKSDFFMRRFKGKELGEMVPVVNKEFNESALVCSRHMAGKYYVVMHMFKSFTYTIYEVDVKAGEVKFPGTLLIKGRTAYEVFYAVVSNDENKFVMAGCRQSKEKSTSGNTELNYCLFDGKTGAVTVGQAQYDVKYAKKDMRNFVYDGQSLYGLSKNYIGGSTNTIEKIDNKANYTYELFKINNNVLTKVASLPVGDRYIKEARMRIYKNSIIVSGYYSSTEDVRGEGIYWCKLTDGKNEKEQFFPFNQKLCSLYDEKCYQTTHKNIGPHSDDLHFQSLVLDSNGTAYLTGQRTVYYEFPVYGSIYTAKVSLEGELLYSQKLPYGQSSGLYANFNFKGSNYFLFTVAVKARDNPYSASPDKEWTSSLEYNLMVIEVANRGEVSITDAKLATNCSSLEDAIIKNDAQEWVMPAFSNVLFIKVGAETK